LAARLVLRGSFRLPIATVLGDERCDRPQITGGGRKEDAG
jgi:hypothetical protein